KITPDDLLREYTPAEVRMLCERTKVRVKMYKMNIVWDAKKRFDKKKRLENKSENFVNRMFEKAYKRKMVKPYSELEKLKYMEYASWETKKYNNARLDRWSLEASKANGQDGASTECILLDSGSDSESLAENMPPLSVEPDRAPLESQPLSESEDSDVSVFLQPPPAPKPMPDPNTEPNVWGIGDPDEVEEADSKGDSTAAVPQTQTQSFDWAQAHENINSEELFVHTIASTQNTEPDYESFGTQLVAASTQESAA
ncbi:hypothetical protein KR032_006577, partial [Drosophila birchii]